MCQPKAGEGRRRWKREECRRAGTGDLKKGEGEKSIIIYLGGIFVLNLKNAILKTPFRDLFRRREN